MSKLSGRSFGIALVLGLSTLASAGTYNFYFNNTEQGDNAVANPSVSVSTPPEAKAKSNRTETSQTPDSTAAAISVPDPTPPAATSEAPSPSTVAKADFLGFDLDNDAPHFRVGLVGLSVVRGEGAGLQPEPAGVQPGGAFTLGFFPWPWIGVTALAGFYRSISPSTGVVMADLELIPIRLSLAGVPDVIELGVMGGVDDLEDYVRTDDSWAGFGGAWHVGARANFNLSRHVGLTAAVRFMPAFAGAEAGLNIRL